MNAKCLKNVSFCQDLLCRLIGQEQGGIGWEGSDERRSDATIQSSSPFSGHNGLTNYNVRRVAMWSTRALLSDSSPVKEN